jgi:two-component system heavy metal sensor histidine kinase CusS
VLNRYRRVMWVALAVVSVVCAAVGYQIARRGVRPVNEVASAAQRIRSTTLHERIDPAGLPREIASLAAQFNEMLDRLQDAFARLSSFSANIAHELRTPIHALRGEVEVALGKPRTLEEYRQVLGSCLEECTQVARLIDRLLFIARAEDPATQIARQPFDVARELAAIREFYEAAAADRDVQIHIEGAEASVIASLDRTLFQRAVGNLIENAMAYTPAGGKITVSLLAGQDGTVRVEVSDTGCGIPPEHLPRIFDRFHRVDGVGPRNGALGMGLGLAITRSVARLHGGDVRVTSEVGVGTRVVLSFATPSVASVGSARADPASPSRPT